MKAVLSFTLLVALSACNNIPGDCADACARRNLSMKYYRSPTLTQQSECVCAEPPQPLVEPKPVGFEGK